MADGRIIVIFELDIELSSYNNVINLLNDIEVDIRENYGEDVTNVRWEEK